MLAGLKIVLRQSEFHEKPMMVEQPFQEGKVLCGTRETITVILSRVLLL